MQLVQDRLHRWRDGEKACGSEASLHNHRCTHRNLDVFDYPLTLHDGDTILLAREEFPIAVDWEQEGAQRA
jgi:hypothetical protein